MKKNIVPGFPYEGAFYWLLSARDWRDSSIKSNYEGGHPYYRTLYGKSPGEFVDETVSLCLIYDQIILAPADCYMPDFKSYLDGGRYENPTLGILSDWAWAPRRGEFEPNWEKLLTSIKGGGLLSGVPEASIMQIVNSTIVQLKIATEYDADIIGNASYGKLCQLIQRELLSYQEVNVVDTTKTLASDIGSVFSLSGLHFSLHNLDEFAALRENKTLKLYGRHFREATADFPVSTDRERHLIKSMLDAIDSEDIAKQIAGGLDISATAAGYLSLIPVIGTAAGIASLAADHVADAAEYAKKQHMWWMLAPEISKTLTQTRLEQRYKELGG